MYTATNDDTVLLVSTAVLLLLVMIILLNRRSSVYKKYHAASSELSKTKLELERLNTKYKKALNRPVKPAKVAANTPPNPQIVFSPIFKKPLDNILHSLNQIQALYKSGTASDITVSPIVKQAITTADLMQQTTTNLALITSLQSTKPNLAPVNLRHELTRLYTTNSKRVNQAGLKLNIDISNKISTIKTDVDLLRKLLGELISNSILYTNEGSVTIKATQTTKNVAISIIDTGIGVRQTEQAKIFDMQYRSKDSRVADKLGTGVGLYMCNIIAGALGAQITVKSRLNHGSEFTLTIPR